jgi:hypothetical protein
MKRISLSTLTEPSGEQRARVSNPYVIRAKNDAHVFFNGAARPMGGVDRGGGPGPIQ